MFRFGKEIQFYACRFSVKWALFGIQTFLNVFPSFFCPYIWENIQFFSFVFKTFFNVFYHVLKKTPSVSSENRILPTFLTPECYSRAKIQGNTESLCYSTERKLSSEVIPDLSLSLSHGLPLRWSKTWVWVKQNLSLSRGFPLRGDLRPEFEFEWWFTFEVIQDPSLSQTKPEFESWFSSER